VSAHQPFLTPSSVLQQRAHLLSTCALTTFSCSTIMSASMLLQVRGVFYFRAADIAFMWRLFCVFAFFFPLTWLFAVFDN